MRYSVSVRFSPDNKLEVSSGKIVISIKSKPERGKANKELIERLASNLD